jgi:hypothetical protein
MTVPILPDPPSRADPATFSSRADAFFDALEDFSVEANLLGQTIDASVAAVENALSATQWVSGSNYSVGNLRFSPATGLLYRCIQTATGRTTDPSTDTAFWSLQSVAAPTLVVNSTTTYTALARQHVEMTNSAQSTVTLPAAPAVGDWVWIGFTNPRPDNVIARNGQPIHGAAEDLIVDRPNAGLILRYISAGFGWRVFK